MSEKAANQGPDLGQLANNRHRRWYLWAVVLLALIISSLSYLHYNQFYGGADEGCYTSMGYLLAHGNGFRPHDPVIETREPRYLDPDLFLPDPYAVDDLKTGRIRAPWFKGYPLLTAPLWRLFGYNGHRMWNPLAAGLVLVLAYLTLATMEMAAGGVAAALLIGTSWTFLWYSRYPMSEMTSALLAMLAMFLVTRYRALGRPRYLWAAGAVVGYATWVHAVNIVFLAGLAVWLVWLSKADLSQADTGAVSRRAAIGRALAVGLLALALGALYLWLDQGTYIYKTNLPDVTSRDMAVSSSTDLFSWSAGPLLLQRHLPDARWTPYFAVINAKFLPWATNWNLLVPLPFTMLAILGLPLALREPRWRPVWAGSLACATASILMLAAWGVGNAHVLYAARRLLPWVLPMAGLLAGVSVHAATKGGSLARKAAVWLFVVALAAAQFSTHVAFYHTQTGTDLRKLAQEVRRAVAAEGSLQQSLVILDAYPGAISSGLRYAEGVPIVHGERLRSVEHFAGIIQYELSQGTRLYMLTTSPGQPGALSDGNQWREVLKRQAIWHDPNSSDVYAFPTLQSRATEVHLFRIEPAGGAAMPATAGR